MSHDRIRAVLLAIVALVLSAGAYTLAGRDGDRADAGGWRVLPLPAAGSPAAALGALGPGKVPVPAPGTFDSTAPLVPITPGAPGSGSPSVSPPARVDIPAIGVRARIVPLGVGADGTLNPPTDVSSVGWWAGGPVPGAVGPAVLAAHVDSRSGPAVFWRLRDLVAGDVVTVTGTDGTATRFVVTSVAQYPKAAFPTAAVYGIEPRPVLRLVTCGGSFDRSAGHYRDNVVVYAVASP